MSFFRRAAAFLGFASLAMSSAPQQTAFREQTRGKNKPTDHEKLEKHYQSCGLTKYPLVKLYVGYPILNAHGQPLHVSRSTAGTTIARLRSTVRTINQYQHSHEHQNHTLDFSYCIADLYRCNLPLYFLHRFIHCRSYVYGVRHSENGDIRQQI